MKPDVVCLFGPTAIGKTALALAVAEHVPCEIISVDSAMVYRGLDIGTAKPDASVRAQVPHHLIDICDPSEPYSAAQFCQQAHQRIAQIVANGKLPLLVGGTMLYFRALQQGLANLPSSNLRLRNEISQQAAQLGWPLLHKQLAAIDPEAAANIKPTDSQRIQRALEVYQLTGQPLSQWWQQQSMERSDEPYHFINVALIPDDRQVLHQAIVQRFDHMLSQDFVGEVKALFDRGDLAASLPAVRSVGYRQVWQYLAGEYDKQQMREKAIVATRQLAKRQMTWIRSWPEVERLILPDTTVLRKLRCLVGW